MTPNHDTAKVLLTITCVATAACYYAQYRLRKYEFKNRTDGGSVRFATYGASVGHRITMSLVRVLAPSFALFSVFGAIMEILRP